VFFGAFFLSSNGQFAGLSTRLGVRIGVKIRVKVRVRGKKIDCYNAFLHVFLGTCFVHLDLSDCPAGDPIGPAGDPIGPVGYPIWPTLPALKAYTHNQQSPQTKPADFLLLLLLQVASYLQTGKHRIERVKHRVERVLLTVYYRFTNFLHAQLLPARPFPFTFDFD